MRLHEAIETGPWELIIEVSRELDRIILKHMHSQLSESHL
ncbi:hypothetical protein Cst_c09330 [Thermoclostridium stercorarium subsp. stercorarium DSM 8532]|uniref:Spo0E like sporulation regulatory protein n=1 Tax=Thermoclostridium stercorarium (strain ATCC 35414 / DSM 8532 / NCIMB 11754) TaxID=1121335 RepID=L7VN80_THES1|nr:hypothetical protein Cst_c09330 [Thermoclostridium stercorarium subsp. stercorarium DSM 8532]